MFLISILAFKINFRLNTNMLPFNAACLELAKGEK